jgi:predicted O-methyltransferase YrrM
MEYNRPSRQPGAWGVIKRWYERRKLLRGWARLYDEGAHTTTHLYELLRSVHQAGLPTIELGKLVEQLATLRPWPLPVARVHPRIIGDASGSAGEMTALAVLVAAVRPRCILEFGTHAGCSTWHLWANAPDAHITTLDLAPSTRVAGSTDLTAQGVAGRPFLPADPRIRVVEVDSRLWTPDLDQVDLCFIDAGHSYECVRSDTEKALEVLTPEGLLIWHDATWTRDGYGVNRYLHELRQAGQPICLLRLSLYDYCGLAVRLPAPVALAT